MLQETWWADEASLRRKSCKAMRRPCADVWPEARLCPRAPRAAVTRSTRARGWGADGCWREATTLTLSALHDPASPPPAAAHMIVFMFQVARCARHCAVPTWSCSSFKWHVVRVTCAYLRCSHMVVFIFQVARCACHCAVPT